MKNVITKKNCWEFMNCGRGPESSGEVCAAAKDQRLHGVHDGKNGGRACWVVAGTLCGADRKPSGLFAQKYDDCRVCEFYLEVIREENQKFILTMKLMKLLKG